jgi:hypothetical protein
MVASGFDFLIYSNSRAELESSQSFSTQSYVEDSVVHAYDLTDREIHLNLSKKIDGDKTLTCRQVTRCRESGRQTQVVTSRYRCSGRRGCLRDVLPLAPRELLPLHEGPLRLGQPRLLSMRP